MSDLLFIDAAFPPPPASLPAGTQGIAGYIGGDTPHVWTAAEWAQYKQPYRLPIFTRSPASAAQAVPDAAEAVSQLHFLGAPKGILVALDSEFSVPSAYTVPFVTALNADGYKVIDYATESTVHGNVNPDGYYWGADITNVPHIHTGDEITQFAFLSAFDESEASPTLPFWKIGDPPVNPPTPKMPPGQWNDPKSWSWADVIVVGRGLDNNLYAFAYDTKTGAWVKCTPFAGEQRV